MDNVDIKINPTIENGQLYEFYKKNNICEIGYGRDMSEIVLRHPSLIVAAYDNSRLIGFARVLFDGLTAMIMEFCLDLEYQEFNEFRKHPLFNWLRYKESLNRK